MEKSRQHHQSSKRRVHDDRDKHAHKSRNDPRASQPHKSRLRSPARLVDDLGLGSRSKPTAGQNNFLAYWLKDAYPHRNHPPDLESVVKETRERKRAQALSDISDSHDEEPMPTKTAFEKRPRHKTHADKYDYKDGPGRKRKLSREQRVVDSKQRRGDEHESRLTWPSQKENSHGKYVKKGSQKVPDSHQRPIETSPEPEPKPSRPHRSSKRRDNGARFDKDLQEIKEFFSRNTDGDRPGISRRRHSRTPGEDYDPSEPPRSPSSGIGDDGIQPRRPWYSDVSGAGSQSQKSPLINPATDILTWSTSEYPPKSITDGKYSEQESESPERPMPPPPSPILYRRPKENIPLGEYGGPYRYSQRTMIEDPYEGLVGNHAMGGWYQRPPLGLGLRSLEWSAARAVTRPLLLDRGFEQSQLVPQRGIVHEGRLSNVDVGYFPHSSQAEFLPSVERGYPLSHLSALDARYPVEETLAMPTGYGHGSIEPIDRISNMGTGADFHPPWETGNAPGFEYDICPNSTVAPTYYSTEPVQNPRKQLKRMKREDYVERLEQETLGTLEAVPSMDDLEFRDQEPIDYATQPHELSSTFESDGLGSRQPFLEGRMGQAMTNRNPLPHLSAGLLTPTHGFTSLTPPVRPESRIHQPLEEGCLSTIWERQSEA